MSSGTTGQVAEKCFSITTAIIVMASILAVLGTAVLSQEVKEGKPKKPRFERTDQVLQDNRSSLIWPLSANVTERQFTWFGTFDGIERIVNKERVAGARDWRVPTREELLTLVELAREQGYDGTSPERSVSAGLASLGFRDVQAEAYWSSTENHYNAAEAWVVDMANGRAAYADKSLYFNLWPVRSAR